MVNGNVSLFFFIFYGIVMAFILVFRICVRERVS
jgi:hypothetical protein